MTANSPIQVFLATLKVPRKCLLQEIRRCATRIHIQLALIFIRGGSYANSVAITPERIEKCRWAFATDEQAIE